MLPYFIYTEDIEGFCQLMGFTICTTVSYNKKVCVHSLKNCPTQLIISYSLDLESGVLIPPEKVLTYLTLMLAGYSYGEAINELNVVG